MTEIYCSRDSLALSQIRENVPVSIISCGIIHKDSEQAYRELYADANALIETQRDIKVLEENGNFEWHRIILSPVFDSEGNYVGSIYTSMNINEIKKQEEAYIEQTRIKKLFSRNSVLIAHFNLTKNIVTDAESLRPGLADTLKKGSVDDALFHLINKVYKEDERDKFEQIKDHDAMLASFYLNHQSHITIRHHHSTDKRCYESTFDLMRNPLTKEVEAVMHICDVTDTVLAEDIVKRLIEIDYEIITTIDAETGEPHPVAYGVFLEVITEQRRLGDNAAGVAACLRKYCIDEDVERVIRETSLAYVKEQLKIKDVHTVIYSVLQDGKVIYKRIVYSYLDETHNTILCAIQDISQSYLNKVSSEC